VESTLSLSTGAIVLAKRQKELLSLIETVDVPHRIDTKLCGKLDKYLKADDTPFANVKNVVFGPVIIFEIGAYATIPKDNDKPTFRHPFLSSFARLVRPSNICVHPAPVCQCQVFEFYQPYLCLLRTGWTWQEMCSLVPRPAVPAFYGQEYDEETFEDWLADGLHRETEHFTEDYLGAARNAGISLLIDLGDARCATVHGLDYWFMSRDIWAGQDMITYVFPAYRSLTRCECDPMAMRVVNCSMKAGTAESLLKGILEEAAMDGKSSRRIEIIGMDEVVAGAHRDVEAEDTSDSDTAEQVEQVKEATAKSAKELGFGKEDVVFRKDFGPGGCACCGLDKDMVHDMMGSAEFMR
jgi:hypothetical protein